MSAVFPSFLRTSKLVFNNKNALSTYFYRNISSNRMMNPNICCSLKSNRFSSSTQPEDKKHSEENSEKIEKRVEEVEQGTGMNLEMQLAELTKSLEETSKQRDELNDKYKRALADSENMRRRLLKQIDDAKLYGIQSFCKDLLEVADVLGKATESVPKEELKETNPHLKSLYEGLTMTEAQLQKVFKRHGLCPLNPLNEKFDPNLHEALFQQEVEGKAPGTVVVVSKIGYKLHERIVRPALVGVAKG